MRTASLLALLLIGACAARALTRPVEEAPYTVERPPLNACVIVATSRLVDSLYVWGHDGFAIPAVGMCWTLTPYPIEGGLLGATVGLVFYVEREEANKRSQQKDGSYSDKPRLDKVGDVIGPVAVFASALVTWGAGFL